MTRRPPRPDGLDLQRLRAIRGRRTDRTHLEQLVTRIEEHLDEHDGYVALSGGKDSVVVADMARRADPATPMVWFDSGLEWPETRTYLHELADTWQLNLAIVHPQPDALEVLEASGLWHLDRPRRPVPPLSQVCIDAPAAAAHERYGPGELWGVRADEAAGRRIMYATALRDETARACSHRCCTTPRERAARHGGVIRRLDGTTAYGPIWDWTSEQVWQHLAAGEIPINPVYDKLRRMGAPPRALRVSHIIDGSRLEHGSAVWLRAGWPDLFDELVQRLPLLGDHA